MPNLHIKTDERRAAEHQAMRDYGINPQTATAQQREYAEQIAADTKRMQAEFNRMEEKSK